MPAASDRLLHLAGELRLAAAGRDGNPPGVPWACLGALAARFAMLSGQASPDLSGALRTIGERLAGQPGGLTPEQTTDLAVWLETHAPLAQAGERRLAAGTDPRGAA